MERQVHDFEELFEVHSVGSFTVAFSIEIEHTVYTQRNRPQGSTNWGAAKSPASARPH